MFGREAHEGVKEISRCEKDDHKYNNAFCFDKHRQHFFKMHAERWTHYRGLNMEKKIQYFKVEVSYSETIDANIGSTVVRGYLIHLDVIYRIISPFLCEGTERSSEILQSLLTPAGKEYRKLTVEHGTKLDIVVGYVAVGIYFRQVSAAMLVPSTGKQEPRLFGVNGRLVRQHAQVVIGINL